MANNNNPVNFGSRTFDQIKLDLINYITAYYPEILQDFSDSNIGSLLLDLNSGVANSLSINTDRVFQETQIDQAQKRQSILNIARNLGFNIPNTRPSVTVVDISVVVPVNGDTPNSAYFPTILPNMQIIGGGKTFETNSVVDFSSPYDSMGNNNRAIVANRDSNGIIANYLLTKRVVVTNGSTNIYKKIVTSDMVVPFYEITLPDPDIFEITSIILLEGSNFSSNPTESDFASAVYKFYEVDYLAQQKVFVENTSGNISGTSEGIVSGTWLNVTRKFTKEFDSNGYCTVCFGSGNSDLDAFTTGMIKAGITNQEFLNTYLSNTSLGEMLKSNYTLFIKYRTGGGSSANVGTGTLTSLGNYQITVSGPDQTQNNNVIRSLTVSNPQPAFGGNSGLSTEQIRYLIKYNFSSQNRSVTTNDYLLQVYKMDGKFGSPFKAISFKENNKVVISILGLDINGNLSNTSNSLLKNNINEYLSGYRSMNDYIEVRDGQIFNLAFDIDVYVQNASDSLIANDIISAIQTYMDIDSHQMNEDLYLGDLQNVILGVNGVINLIKITVYNKVGDNYSMNVISQNILDNSTGEVELINNTIHSVRDSMFEVKFPNKDIRVFLRKRTQQ